MPRDNTDLRIARLVRDYRRYNQQIEEMRSRMRQYAQEKAECVATLREMMPAAEVAARLDVTPSAVYQMLQEASDATS